MTILAARLVVPPDLIAPAALSPILRNESSPLELPPPDRGSPAPRILEKLEPVPDPYLKSSASRLHSPMIDSEPPTSESDTDWMKHAWGWGCSYALVEYSTIPVSGLTKVWPWAGPSIPYAQCRPVLNHWGLLGAER